MSLDYLSLAMYSQTISFLQHFFPPFSKWFPLKKTCESIAISAAFQHPIAGSLMSAGMR
jgi:hypothetical protein